MEFLGVGPMELIFVLLIALVIIGPRDLGKTARTLGRALNRLYKSEGWRTFTQASRSLRGLPNRLAREAELDEIQELRRTVKEAESGIQKDLHDLRPEAKPQPALPPDRGLQAWTTPPAPEAAPKGDDPAKE